MRFVRKLRKGEQRELTRLVHSGEDGRLVRRAQIIRLSSQGHSAPAIAEAWGLHVQTVRRGINAFNAEGLASLADKPRSGRPSKTGNGYVELLKEAVTRCPRDVGYPFSSWTLERLREHLARQTGTLLHPCYLSQVMRRHGIVYRRPKHVMGHLRDRQDYQEKKAVLEFLKKARSSPKRPSTCTTLTNVRFTSTPP